jgi:diapolycopene oxygenase
MVMSKKTAVIVGSGAGGLASGLLLQSKGWSVTLLERNETVGGKLGVYEESGFRFDTGPTILTLPGVLRILFAESGADINDYLQLINLDPQWRCFFEDGTTFELKRDDDAQLEEVRRIAPNDVDGFHRLLEIGNELYGLSQENFFFRNVGSVGDIMASRSFDPSSIKLVRTLRQWQTYQGLLESKLKSKHLIQTLEHLVQYVGSSPFLTPAIFGLMLHVQLRKGCWYPIGGMNAIADAIAKRFKEIGGEVVTGTQVAGVRKSNGKITEIITSSGVNYAADHFVFNADLNVVKKQILGEPSIDKPQACSGVVIFAGVNTPFKKLAHHNFLFSRDSMEEFTHIYTKGIRPPDPTVYICDASKTDGSAAPNGKESIYFLIHVPSLNGKTDWKTEINSFTNTIYQKTERLLQQTFRKDIVVENTLKNGSIRITVISMDSHRMGE